MKIRAMGEEITELRAEVERLELALSGKTMCYDPDSYNRGMLDAAEIVENRAIHFYHEWGNTVRKELAEEIRAKAEGMK